MLARISGCLVGALLAGCTAGETLDAPAPATGTAAEQQHLAFVVPEGQALVTLYRPFNFLGGGRTYYFTLNGGRIPGIDVGNRHTEVVPPGTVKLRGIDWPVSPELAFVAREGAAYFIAVTPEPLLGGPQLSHAEPGKAAAIAAKLTPAGS